jgi:hypothetical protein
MKISEKLEVAYATMRPPTLEEVEAVRSLEMALKTERDAWIKDGNAPPPHLANLEV